MLLDTKFNIGQKVYFLNQTMIKRKEDCANCQSKGELELARGGKIPCNICYGKGNIEKPVSRWDVDPDCLQITAMGYGGKDIYYRLRDTKHDTSLFGEIIGIDRSEKNCFNTRAEAEAEARKRNAALGHKPKLGVVGDN